MDYQDNIKAHYIKNWKTEPNIFYWDKGPAHELPYQFRVLEFEPTEHRKMWTYSTCCMSQESDSLGIELHLFSARKDEGLIELLTVTAHYHRTGHFLALSDTVNWGQPWQGNSICRHGLISLPYLDGPDLENLEFDNRIIKFYWLIPITKAEVEFKKEQGINALETEFEKQGVDYLNNDRVSIV